MKFPVVVRLLHGEYQAKCPYFQDVLGVGATEEQAIENLRSFIEAHKQDVIELGLVRLIEIEVDT